MSAWTAADHAELEVLIHELVRAYFEHRDCCASCARGYPPCPHVREAIKVVIEWREARALLSHAAALRAEQNGLEVAT